MNKVFQTGRAWAPIQTGCKANRGMSTVCSNAAGCCLRLSGVGELKALEDDRQVTCPKDVTISFYLTTPTLTDGHMAW